MSIVIVGKRPLHATESARCLACGVRAEIPVDEIHYREFETARTTRMFQATRRRTGGCQDLYANRALPVHPWWFRRGKDGTA